MPDGLTNQGVTPIFSLELRFGDIKNHRKHPTKTICCSKTPDEHNKLIKLYQQSKTYITTDLTLSKITLNLVSKSCMRDLKNR